MSQDGSFPSHDDEEKTTDRSQDDTSASHEQEKMALAATMGHHQSLSGHVVNSEDSAACNEYSKYTLGQMTLGMVG